MELLYALLAICAVTVEFPTQRAVTQSFGVFFDLRLNKRLSSKQSRGWSFETPLGPLWHHGNVLTRYQDGNKDSNTLSGILYGIVEA